MNLDFVLYVVIIVPVSGFTTTVAPRPMCFCDFLPHEST